MDGSYHFGPKFWSIMDKQMYEKARKESIIRQKELRQKENIYQNKRRKILEESLIQIGNGTSFHKDFYSGRY